MSKLFDFSSLAMIPSAYKDGKLYSVRPTDGSGDFTFSRGSNLAATRVDVNGLIEKGRENVLLQSNQFDTTWGPSSSISVTGGQSGYDGTNDAWLLKRSDASARYINQNITLGSSVYTYSVYAKPESENWMYFWSYNGSGSVNAYFDLQNGVVGNTSGLIDATIVAAGNGYYRCSITYNNNIASVRIYPAVANGSTTGGIVGAGIYIQDSQLEAGLVATDYIETGASTAQAGILEDMPRLDYSGGATCPSLLLEPQRTNTFTDSEYFNGANWILQDATITSNAALSPEGVQNASLYTTTSDLYDFVRQNISFVSGTTYTYSVFAKAGTSSELALQYHSAAFGVGQSVRFDLSDGTYTIVSGTPSVKVDDYGNGWYRCAITATATASSTRSTGFSSTAAGAVTTLYLYGAQMETGSYPTSYIPTYGSSVTRSNDSGVLTALPDSLADNYTIFLELERMVPRLTNAVDMISFYGSGSSRIRIQSHNPDYFRVRFYAADGSTSGSLYETSGDFAQGNNYKAAIVYSNGTFKCFANGSLFGTLNAVIDVSSSYLRTECISKQLVTFPTALTDSECIALTTL